MAGALAVISVLLFSLAFLCPIVGAGIGMALRHRLPEHHLSRESVDVIKLAMGLMATLVALTLGLLIQSAARYRATVETEYRLSLASIVHLDEYLQAYGVRARGRFASTYAMSPPAVSKGTGPMRTSDRRVRRQMPGRTSSPRLSGRLWSWSLPMRRKDGFSRRRCSSPIASPTFAGW
jgi:hypothetical protein